MAGIGGSPDYNLAQGVAAQQHDHPAAEKPTEACTEPGPRPGAHLGALVDVNAEGTDIGGADEIMLGIICKYEGTLPGKA